MMTVGELREALAAYPDSAELEVFMVGEDRLNSLEVYTRGGPVDNPDGPPDLIWPLILVSYGEG